MANSQDSSRLEAIIELKDEFTDKMKNIVKTTKEAKKKMQDLKPKIEVLDESKKTIDRVKNNLKQLKKAKHLVKLDARDNVTKQIKKIKRELAVLKAKRILLIARDKASKVVEVLASKIKNKIKNRRIKLEADDHISPKLKGIAGLLNNLNPLTLGLGGAVAGAGAVLKNSIGSGAKMQQQNVSMEHFMKVGNEGKSAQDIRSMTKSYVNNLKSNANATPFGTDEVITTGTRALTIAGGNTQEAMKLVKLAEDMSASDPNKSLSDAVEALADAKMGEFERMKEFGFKGSKAEFDKAGGDFFKMKSQDGKTVNQIFGGLAKEQANTAQGKFSTITGNLQTGVTNFGEGLLQGLDPLLGKIRDSFSNLFGNEESQNKIIQFGQKVGEVLNKVCDGIKFVTDFIRSAFEMAISNMDFSAIQQAFQPAIDISMEAYNAIKKFMDEVINRSPQAQAIFSVLGKIWQVVMQALGMAVSEVATVIKAAFMIVMAIIKAVITVVKLFGKAWDKAKAVVSGAVKVIGSIIKTVFNGIKTAINGVKWAIDQFGRAWKRLKDKIENNPITQTIKRVVSGDDDTVSSSSSSKHSRKATHGPAMAYGGRIPYNNYPVRLHEGEVVLTKHEANKLNNRGNEGIYITINSTVREEADIDKIINGVVRKIKLAKAGGV